MSADPAPIFRFAPSPNGYLHLGHAYSAIMNHDLAASKGGRFLVRIDDMDQGRARPAFEAAIFEDLAWLGLAWEEPVWHQSEHIDTYLDALARLNDQGLLRRSFATRREIANAAAAAEGVGRPWRRDPDGGWCVPDDDEILADDVRAERQASGAAPTLRLKMADALARLDAPLTFIEEDGGPAGETGEIRTDPGQWGDVVLGRSDIAGSYHLSVVVDDAVQAVTHVVRGRDLFFATAIHRLLQTLLGLPAPIYRHHRLILDEAGKKLSKSAGSRSLRDIRAAGATPADVRRMIGLEADPGKIGTGSPSGSA